MSFDIGVIIQAHVWTKGAVLYDVLVWNMRIILMHYIITPFCSHVQWDTLLSHRTEMFKDKNITYGFYIMKKKSAFFVN